MIMFANTIDSEHQMIRTPSRFAVDKLRSQSSGASQLRITRGNLKRSLQFESLETKELPAVNLAATYDVVRTTSQLRSAEQKAISTGANQRVVLDLSRGTSAQENSFLRNLKLSSGSVHADVTVRFASGALTETFTITESYASTTAIDDIRSAKVDAKVTLTGTYSLNTSGTVKATDWRSEGTTNVVVQSGPLKGVDYQLTLLAVAGHEYGDKLSGLTQQELVAASIRNFLPANLTLGDLISSDLDRLANYKIPGVDVRSKLSSYQILLDALSGPGGRTDDQIWSDVKANSNFVIGVNSSSDLLRFAEGGVTSIVGMKFSYSKDFNLIPPIVVPNIAVVPLFGGVITASLGAEATLTAGISLKGMLVADSRGYGLSEGSNASVSIKVDTSATGTIALVGFDTWAIAASKTSVGIFTKGTLTVTVGNTSAAYDALVNGHVLYVTSGTGQKSFVSYLNGTFTASAGASFSEKIYILGVRVWKKSKEKEWTIYTNSIFSAKNQLGA